MADNGIFATHAEILGEAGTNVSSVISAGDATADALLNDFIAKAEGLINATTTKNWSPIYSTLNDEVRDILKGAASSWAAAKCIKWDMSGYTSRQEALTMINLNLFQFKTAMIELKDKETQSFITKEDI